MQAVVSCTSSLRLTAPSLQQPSCAVPSDSSGGDGSQTQELDVALHGPRRGPPTSGEIVLRRSSRQERSQGVGAALGPTRSLKGSL
jgi:hypothetical protein